MNRCSNCGRKTDDYTNYCDMACMTSVWRDGGAKQHTPNGLPVTCLTATGLMLEAAHGDHPDYVFPVDIEVKSHPSDVERGLPEVELEKHALIYSDGRVAVTLHECNYEMWHVDTGEYLGGSVGDGDADRYVMTKASRDAITRRFGAKRDARLRGPWEGGE